MLDVSKEQVSDYLHSRLNLLDDQVTINYNLDVIPPTQAEAQSKPLKKKMTRRQKFARRNNYRELTQE